jgi:polar amino acid transport system permease protein
VSWTLFELLVEASLYTILLSAVSIVIGLTIGVFVAGALMSPRPSLSWPARIFVSFFRGVPLLVQLLLLYNLLPAAGVDVPGWVAAIVGLSLCTAAYQAENLRGGFGAVPKGLIEAADMVGLNSFQQFRRIRAPIAFRLTLPSLVNEAILILKASSLVSVVGVIELTRMAQDLSASTYQPLPLYASAGLLYYVINRVVAWLGGVAERRLTWGRA